VSSGATTTAGELALTVGGRTWRFVPSYQPTSYSNANTVSVALGATDTPGGVKRLELGFDGTTVSGSTSGRSWRASDGKNNGFTREGYLYFAVDDTFLADVDDGQLHIEVDFLDEPNIGFRLDYDGQDHQRMLDGVLTPTHTANTHATNAWRTASFDLDDIRFASRIGGSPDGRSKGVADFRIASNKPLKVTSVRVVRS
jgi:hypothetical protein